MKTLDEVEPRIPIGPDTTPGDSDSTYKITEPGSYYLTDNFTSDFKHGIKTGSGCTVTDNAASSNGSLADGAVYGNNVAP
jgi:hypothetical protein